MSIENRNHSVIKKLAQGDYLDLYEGEDVHLGSVVIAKLKAPYAGMHEVERSFTKELKRRLEYLHAALPVDAARVPRALGRGFDAEGLPYLLFERHEGQTLDGQTALHKNPAQLPVPALKLSAQQVWGVAEQLVRTLQTGARAKMFHGRLHPGNVLVLPLPGYDVTVVLLDFGLSLVRAAARRGKGVGATLEYHSARYLPYCAPERRSGEEQESDKSDIYSLGALIYWLRTASEPPAELSVMPTTLTEVEFETLRRTLAIDPRDRPSYDELLTLIHEAKESLGPYELHEEIAQAGLWTEYRAYHLHRRVWGRLFLLHHAYTAGSVVGERALSSARLLQSQPPEIVTPILDSGTLPNGQVFRLLEPADGEDKKTLRRLLLDTPSRRIEQGRALALMHSAAQALLALHRLPAVHQGLSPESLEVWNRDGIELMRPMDMGTAASISSATQSQSSDVLSLGTIFHEMLIGHVPPATLGPGQSIAQRLTDLRPNLLPELAELIEEMLDPNPMRRPTAEQLTSHLNTLIQVHRLQTFKVMVAKSYDSEAQTELGGSTATLKPVRVVTPLPSRFTLTFGCLALAVAVLSLCKLLLLRPPTTPPPPADETAGLLEAHR